LNGTGTAFALGYPFGDTLITRTYTMKTTDYGLSWVVKNFITYRDITGCSLIDQNNFFISGGTYNLSAVILKSTNGGNVFINQTGNEIPSTFSLYQNYPNPFNPTTTIKFAIPKSSSVKIAVFDVSGKEVDVILNETLQAGTYEIQWNGSKFSSGAYFYKISARDFSETKTMLMIK